MAHRTFFSFHYERDVQRASVVRKSSTTKPNIEPDWIEAGIWEEAKTKGDAAVKKLITDALKGTTVTAVLIGAKTSERKWVKEEIAQSEARGNGLFGIYIHNIKDFKGQTDYKGSNPLPSKYPTYDWVADDGYNNLGKWVDAAYNKAHS
jgi:hypothetical protein